jgi:hypothetical protein
VIEDSNYSRSKQAGRERAASEARREEEKRRARAEEKVKASAVAQAQDKRKDKDSGLAEEAAPAAGGKPAKKRLNHLLSAAYTFGPLHKEQLLSASCTSACVPVMHAHSKRPNCVPLC